MYILYNSHKILQFKSLSRYLVRPEIFDIFKSTSHSCKTQGLPTSIVNATHGILPNVFLCAVTIFHFHLSPCQDRFCHLFLPHLTDYPLVIPKRTQFEKLFIEHARVINRASYWDLGNLPMIEFGRRELDFKSTTNADRSVPDGETQHYGPASSERSQS